MEAEDIDSGQGYSVVRRLPANWSCILRTHRPVDLGSSPERGTGSNPFSRISNNPNELR
jgi:hypothetical protein